MKPTRSLLPSLDDFVKKQLNGFDEIPNDRKGALEPLSEFIRNHVTSGSTSNLVFICTHNSRRSHMSQLWAQAAAYFYGVPDVRCFSGGTEATAFNPRAVAAMRKAGFDIREVQPGSNPVYEVRFASGAEPVTAFSKTFGDPFNPQRNFAAVMTCSDADEACPFVPGTSLRVAIPYEDPKKADGTPDEELRYDERCRQIAREMLYMLSRVPG
jgi:protein-tyrosine-phosphatase